MLAGLLLASCGVMDKVAPGRDKIDYKKSKAIDTLEVPPELSSSTINEAPEQLERGAGHAVGFRRDPAGTRVHGGDAGQFRRACGTRW